MKSKLKMNIAILFSFLFFACSQGQTQTVSDSGKQQQRPDVHPVKEYTEKHGLGNWEVATFAGGCFWCTEASFERINGVVDVISGYSGGEKEYPTYKAVSAEKTKHAEAIHIYYDPAKITFDKLLEVFFVAHDATQYHRQGPDVGSQYRSAVYYHGNEQKQKVEAYIKKLEESGKLDGPITTEVAAFEEFWVAEGYHQDYYKHNPGNPYIISVSRPKVNKVMKTFKDILKPQYK